MKLSDIINQLKKVLPFNSTAFADDNTVTLTFSGGVVTATTPTAHGLVDGQDALILNAAFPTEIASIVRVDSVATITTATDHDLTERYHTTVNISGSDQAEYNGDLTLLSVNNRREFEVFVSGSPATPATGTMILNEDRVGYSGIFTVTVTSPTTFTYEITQTPATGSSGDLKSNFRISGGLTYDKILDSYTKHPIGDAYCYVVPQPSRSERQKGNQSDSLNHISPGKAVRINELEEFTVYVFIPCDSISGIPEYDLSEDIKVSLFSALVGYAPPTYMTSARDSAIAPLTDGFHAYNGVVYVHFFDFQSSRTITTKDTYRNDTSVAMRDIDITTLNSFDEPLTIAQIDLDKEPLP